MSLDINGLNIGHNSSSRDIRFLINETPHFWMNQDGSLRVGSNYFRPDSNNASGVTIFSGKSYNFSNSDYGVYKSSSIGKKIFFRYGTTGPVNTEIGSIEYDTNSSVRYNTSSDARLKENFQTYNANKIIKDINSYKFTWKDTNITSYGVSAQEILGIPDISNIISGNTTGNLYSMDDMSFNFLQIDYSRFVPLLLRSNYQLIEDDNFIRANVISIQNENNNLKANIASLISENTILKGNIANLKTDINALNNIAANLITRVNTLETA